MIFTPSARACLISARSCRGVGGLALGLHGLLPQPIGVGKVAERRVKDVERLPAERPRGPAERASSRSSSRSSAAWLRRNSSRVLRDGLFQGRGDVGRDDLEVRGRQPDVRIGLALVIVLVVAAAAGAAGSS